METRYTYKIFTMDDANDIIHNSQSEIDWWKILNWKAFIKLWCDYIPTNCIKRVSEINADNKELRKTLPQHEKDKTKAIMYKVSAEESQDFLSYKQQNVWNLPNKSS